MDKFNWLTLLKFVGIPLISTFLVSCNPTTDPANTNTGNNGGNNSGGTTGFTTPFITTWKTDNPGISDNDSIWISTQSSSESYTVDWGDGNVSSNVIGQARHEYATAGTYTVSITGNFPGLQMANDDQEKLLSVEQWGDGQWVSMFKAFYDCIHVEINATDSPDLSAATDLRYAFSGAESVNADFSGWDTSTITNMSFAFEMATAFNGNVSTWNTSAVTDMEGMFWNASGFNGDITGWNTSLVENMSYMFRDASAFDQNIGNWDIEAVTTMDVMLEFSGLSSSTYDSILNGWASQTPQLNVELGAMGIEPTTASDSAKSVLENTYNWTIEDGI